MKTFSIALCTFFGLAASSVFGQSKVTIHLHPNQTANYEIPRTIFGSFLEPIGNSTYNGLWAELLQNPSFEENLWSAPAIAEMLNDRPELGQSSRLALPLPWEPLDVHEGNRYEPRWGDAANSWRSLAVFGVPDKPTGVKQLVYLPQRTGSYNGSIYLKHVEGPDELTISLRRRGHGDDVLASATVHASNTDWKKYEFPLQFKQGLVAPGEPVDFTIELKGDERVIIDQASLMPADAIDGMDPEMITMAKQMHTPLVRFGGNFTSAYHWRDGIGPRDKRVNMLNIAWGMPEYNQFGTDEFLRFCELIGAQPQIALNMGSGTAQEAADWVRYVDEHFTKHSGLTWEMGNELWGNWNLASPTIEELPGRTRAYSEAIRAVDPTAQLIATGQDPDVYPKWNAAELSDPAGTFNFLSTHFVVTTDRTEQHDADPSVVAEDAFALPVELGRKLRQMQAQINSVEAFRNKAHIAFTEWLFVANGARADAPRFDNMGGAVGVGGFFNMLLENADIVPISDMTGIIEFAGIWKKHGIVYGTPSYYTFQLYSTADIDKAIQVANDSPTYDVHHGVTRLPEIPNVPTLDTVAALNKAGDTLTIFCVNRSLTEDMATTVDLGGFHAKSAVMETVGPRNSIYETNNEHHPRAITPQESGDRVSGPQWTVTLPKASISRIELHSR